MEGLVTPMGLSLSFIKKYTKLEEIRIYIYIIDCLFVHESVIAQVSSQDSP